MRVRTAVVALMMALLVVPALAQFAVPGLPITPLRYCQLPVTTSALNLTASTCASFTGTGSGTTLTAASVTGGLIQVGDTIAGTGVPAGTTIIAQLTGPTGGAGTYRTSAATTSNSAALAAGGIPSGANAASFVVEVAAIRFRDDGTAPTASIGVPLAPVSSTVPGAPFPYVGTLAAFQVIAVTGSPVLDVAYYHAP